MPMIEPIAKYVYERTENYFVVLDKQTLTFLYVFSSKKWNDKMEETKWLLF